MPCYAIDGLRPVVDPTAFVHPMAVLIGDVHIGPGCYVAPLASLRGDFGRIVVEAGANVQDSCTLHGFPGGETRVGPEGHIGHGAVLHGCTVGAGALVGMNAVIMDEAVIGERCIIGASAFVAARAVLEPAGLYVGSPARRVRDLKESEMAWKQRGTQAYQQLARRCLASLVEVPPLAQPEPGRPTLPDQAEVRPLVHEKQRGEAGDAQ